MDATDETTEGRPPTTDRRLALALFLFLLPLYLLTTSGRLHVIDEYEAYWMAQSLVQRGEMTVPQAVRAGQYYGKPGADGRPWAPWGPGHALAALPGYLLGTHLLHPLLNPPWPADDTAVAAVLVTCAMVGALTGALLFLLFRALGASSGLAILSALLLGTTTPLWPYATYFYSEIWRTFFFVAALYGFVRAENTGDPKCLAMAGASVGVATLMKATSVLAAVPFGIGCLYLSKPSRWRALAVFSIPVVIAGLLYAGYNIQRYGNPLDLGYVAMESRVPVAFEWNSLPGLFGLTLSPGKGLLLFCPLILIAALGWPRFLRERRVLAAVTLGTAVLFLLFHAHYRTWDGPYSFGPRYLVPVIPFFLLPLFRALPTLSKRAAIGAVLLTLFGVYVQLLGVTTSYKEDQAAGRSAANWNGNRYFTEDFRYRFTYNPLASQSRLLFFYASRHLREKPAPPLGLGLDLWPLYYSRLARATGRRAPRKLLLGGILVLLVGLAGSGAFLIQSLRPRKDDPRPDDPPAEQNEE